MCCSSWVCKWSDVTERLKKTTKMQANSEEVVGKWSEIRVYSLFSQMFNVRLTGPNDGKTIEMSLVHECSVISNSATPLTVAHQIPLSMEFSKQGYLSALPFPTPEDLLETRDQTHIICVY